jgi:hypothetical protein
MLSSEQSAPGFHGIGGWLDPQSGSVGCGEETFVLGIQISFFVVVQSLAHCGFFLFEELLAPYRTPVWWIVPYRRFVSACCLELLRRFTKAKVVIYSN